jgi:hypothetical protein
LAVTIYTTLTLYVAVSYLLYLANDGSRAFFDAERLFVLERAAFDAVGA